LFLVSFLSGIFDVGITNKAFARDYSGRGICSGSKSHLIRASIIPMPMTLAGQYLNRVLVCLFLYVKSGGYSVSKPKHGKDCCV
jgi:hypothetical protein